MLTVPLAIDSQVALELTAAPDGTAIVKITFGAPVQGQGFVMLPAAMFSADILAALAGSTGATGPTGATGGAGASGPTGSTGAPPPAIQINGSAGPVTVSAGAAIAATVVNGPGNPGDWVGIFALATPSGTSNSVSWKWLSTDAQGSVPPTGVTSATVHFSAPAAAGQYDARFFPNNGGVVTARSAVITVTAGATGGAGASGATGA
jgi:hypothetical protein